MRSSASSSSSANSRVTARLIGSRARNKAKAPSATETATGRFLTALQRAVGEIGALVLDPVPGLAGEVAGLQPLLDRDQGAVEPRAGAMTASRLACSTCSEAHGVVSPRASACALLLVAAERLAGPRGR